MKKISLLLTLTLLSALIGHAQDVIVKNDKSELKVKVEEITANTIKFRYFSRLDGPVYNLDKSDVFLIIYKDGNRESFTTPAPVAVSVPVSATQPTTTHSGFVSKEAPEQPTRLAQNTTTRPTTQQSTSAPISLKDHGWAYGVGYMTLTTLFARIHGYTLTYGYYKLLGPKRNAGLMLDLAGSGFFTKDSPTFFTLTGNGLLRLGEGSKAYIGTGLGYGLTFVPIPTYDRYGTVISRSTASHGDVSGSAFIGIGMFRAGLTLPSLGSSGGGLFTIGLYTNPFK